MSLRLAGARQAGLEEEGVAAVARNDLSTQKIQKHQLFEPGLDPRTLPGMMDLRTLKRRDTRPTAIQPAAA